MLEIRFDVQVLCITSMLPERIMLANQGFTVLCFLEKKKQKKTGVGGDKISLVTAQDTRKEGKWVPDQQFKELRIFFFNLHIKNNGKALRIFKHDLICFFKKKHGQVSGWLSQYSM